MPREYRVYRRRKATLLKKWNKVVETYNDLKKNLLKRALRDAYNAFKRISRNAVEDWYASYHPRYYKRTYDLKHIPKAEIYEKKQEVRWEFNPENLRYWHRIIKKSGSEGKQYLYRNSFVEGWHGGADWLGNNPAPGYEEPHPKPGVPYWRTPMYPEDDHTLIFEHWYHEPANREGLKISERIKKEYKEYCAQLQSLLIYEEE